MKKKKNSLNTVCNSKIDELKAGLYIRVSTEQQVERESLQTQEDRLTNYCKYSNIMHFKIYRDAGVSAKNTEREAYKRLIEDVKNKHINIVIFTKLDRITRSLPDLLEFANLMDKMNVQFKAIDQDIDTSNSHGRFMLNFLGILAQFEREMNSERVKIDMNSLAEKGIWNGGITPYGYITYSNYLKYFKSKYSSNDELVSEALKICPRPKDLFVYDNEAKVVKLIYDTYLKLNSIRGTTHAINEKGILNRNGMLWSSTSIHRILENPIYIGKITYGKRRTNNSGKLVSQDTWIESDGNHDPIIDQEIFERVGFMLSGDKDKPTKSNRIYLLGGIIICKKCGGRMYGYTNSKKNGISYPYYKCYNRQSKGKMACVGQSVPAREIEAIIINEISKKSKEQQLLTDKELMVQLYDNENVLNEIEQSINNYEEQERKFTNAKKKYLNLYINGDIEDKEYLENNNYILEELRKVQENIKTYRDTKNDIENKLSITKASFEQLINFDHNWDILDEVGKKLRISSVVYKVRVDIDEGTVEMLCFTDNDKVSRTDRGSWRQPA